MSQINRLEMAKFSVMWKIVSKLASDFTHDFCDEFYMDPIWDLFEPPDEDDEVPTEPFWKALTEVRNRLNSGHPKYGQLKMSVKLDAMCRFSAAQEDLKKVLWPGWSPLSER